MITSRYEVYIIGIRYIIIKLIFIEDIFQDISKYSLSHNLK